jgi:DNA polymerase III delta prime subunit
VSQNEKKQIPLVLKYKPTNLDDVVGRKEIVDSFRRFIRDNHIPNMLFYGTQGTGKTLLAELFIHEYEKTYGRVTSLIVDASKKNKVDDMKGDIVDFMKSGAIGESKRKILILDEADEISFEGQAALRRPIETAMTNCSVIITCNYDNKIIMPLQSRCTGYYFGTIEESEIDRFIYRIIKAEDILIGGDEKHIFEQIHKYGRGEIRYIINNFLEHARSKGVLDQSIIDLVYSENKSYASLLFSGKIDEAILTAYRNPRGSISGAIDFIMEDPSLDLPYPSRVKLIEWFVDTLRDMTLGMPYHIAIKMISHKVAVAMMKKKEPQPTPSRVPTLLKN